MSHIRYQGAIMRGNHILLIKHREHKSGRAYWIIPGGGRESGESEEECVRREMYEETGLTVTVERLLLDEMVEVHQWRNQHKTYLCRADAGDAQPGYEPEPEVAEHYAITEVGWFDLSAPASWDPLVKADPITYPLLQKIQSVLGYEVKDERFV
jgi:8-oxo-dGTP pyrophosphatase MutT (NUDIX family)